MNIYSNSTSMNIDTGDSELALGVGSRHWTMKRRVCPFADN